MTMTVVIMLAALAAGGHNLPYTCDQVRMAVQHLGSLEAAEQYAARNGIKLSAKQRRQARACVAVS